MLALLQAMWFKGSKGTYANKKKLKCLVTLVKYGQHIKLIIGPHPLL